MVNDIVLSGLINLFALFGAKAGVDAETSKALLSTYLKRHFGIRSLDEYLGLYDDLSGLYEAEPDLDKEVIIEGICTKLRGEMRTELKRLHTDTNSTFVYVTHDQLEAMTLSTKVCLMETGVLQQYAPPLTIYNEPANTFVASFVGNPTMNFIPATISGISGQTVTLDALGKKMVFTAKAPLENLGREAILGVRPEFLPIREDGALTAAIYSTLPAGMETTVKASCGDTMLTSVVFGSVDYRVDAQVHMAVVGDSIVLFDKATSKSVGVGKLEIQ